MFFFFVLFSYYFIFFFFFSSRRRHTRLQGDWSSDVCSSDLNIEIGCRSISVCHLGNIAYELRRPLRWDPAQEEFVEDSEANRLCFRQMRSQIGRASCRERV